MKLYHVSEKYLGKEVMLSPRIPNNQMTKLFGEDSITPRVCFCESVCECLTAIGDNLKDKELYVYEIVIDERTEINRGTIKRPDTTEVPDTDTFREIWLLRDCKLSLSNNKKIIVKDGYDAYIDENESKKYVAWNWEWQNSLKIAEGGFGPWTLTD